MQSESHSFLWRAQNRARWIGCRLRGAVLSVRLRLCGGTVGQGLCADRAVRFRYPPGSSWRIGRDVYLGYGVVFDSPGTIVIGDQCRVNSYTTVSALDRVTIGARTLIGECCSIRDGNHNTDNGDIAGAGATASPVKIGSGVWIGRGCAILAGVSIEDGAVVGANAVVTKDVPANTLVVGVPAVPKRVRG